MTHSLLSVIARVALSISGAVLLGAVQASGIPHFARIIAHVLIYPGLLRPCCVPSVGLIIGQSYYEHDRTG